MEKGIYLRDFDDLFKNEFVNYFKENHKHQSFNKNVLVINVPDVTIDTRLRLRTRINKYKNSTVVIVSQSKDVAVLAWKINADQFLLIDDFHNQQTLIDIVKTIQKAQLRIPKTLNSISFKFIEGTTSYQLDDILYIKANGSYSNIIGKKKNSPPISKNLKDIEDRLRVLPNFYRYNKSYILNLNNIVELSGRKIIFDSGKEIEMSKYGTSFKGIKNQLLWDSI